MFPPATEQAAKAREAVERNIRQLPTEYLTLALKVAADELAKRIEDNTE